MTQYARPTSDISLGGWNQSGSTTDLWQYIDEAPGSTDTVEIRTPLNPTTSNDYQFGCKSTSVNATSGLATVKWKARKVGAGTGSVIRASIYSSSGLVAQSTQVALSFTASTGSFTYASTLPSNYANLKGRLTVLQTSGSGGRGVVQYFEVSLPDAGSTGAATNTVTALLNVSVQNRPAPPVITSAIVAGAQATVKITPSTEGYPARWYQKKVSATTYLLDGMSTAGTTSWVYYGLAGLTNYNLGVSHYNTTGRVESVWDTTSTNVTVSTLGARRVSGRVVG